MRLYRLGTWLIACVAALPIWDASAQSTMRSTRDNGLIESYVAYIGDDDLYNSQGVRLTEPWQIIRQDRANFHRFGLRDPGDENDSFFASSRNRAIMERMLANGRISRQAARDLVRGGALVLVEIYGSGSIGRYVVVTTAN